MRAADRRPVSRWAEQFIGQDVPYAEEGREPLNTVRALTWNAAKALHGAGLDHLLKWLSPAVRGEVKQLGYDFYTK